MGRAKRIFGVAEISKQVSGYLETLSPNLSGKV